MFQLLNDYKFRLLNLLILFCIAFYSFAYNIPIFIIFALANAFIIQSILLLTTRHKIIFTIFSLLFALLIGIEFTQVAIYSSRINYGIIASIFETNEEEALSMLSTIYKYIPLSLFMMFVLLGSFWTIRKEQSKKTIKKRWIFFNLAIGLSLISIKSYRYTTKNLDYYNQVLNDFRSYPLLTINEVYFHWTSSFFHTASLITAYLQEQYKFKKLVNINQVLPNAISGKNTIINIPNTIFIIIGESSNRDHYSLYKYENTTTPMLDSLFLDKKLIHFKSISSSPITRDAIPFLLTFGTPQNTSLQYTEESIISLAKRQGYETYWISNQFRTGASDSPIGYIAARSDYTSYSKDKVKDDMNLIQESKKIYSPNKKQLIVLHLTGSHQSYKERFDELDSQIIDSICMDSTRYIDYDKTIYHTNRVLKGLYDTFFCEKESVRSVLFYTSDHGEIVNLGHGFENSNMDQYKIPFIVFGSSYFTNIDSLINKYSNNGIFNSSNFPYVFAELIGYSINENATKKSKNDALYYKQGQKILKFSTNID